MPRYPTVICRNRATRFFLQSEFDFNSIPGLSVDLNPISSKIGAVDDGDPVSTLTDSKQGLAFSQIVDSKRPLWKAKDTQFAGNPSLSFDGFDDFLLYSGNLGHSQGVIFVVCKLLSIVTSTAIGSAKTSSAIEYFHFKSAYATTQKMTIEVYNGVNMHAVRNNTNITTASHVLALKSSGTEWSFWLDGIDQAEVIETSSNSGRWFNSIAANNVTLGKLVRNLEVAPFYGYIARALIYSQGLSTTNIDKINTELMRKYGI